MKLKLVKSEGMEDWYVIERAEHDGREWVEPVGTNGYALRRSARICGADVEGSLEEMFALATAIGTKTPALFKRCAVQWSRTGEGFVFWSPRNSADVSDPVSYEDALDLERQIVSERNAVARHPPGGIW